MLFIFSVNFINSQKYVKTTTTYMKHFSAICLTAAMTVISGIFTSCMEKYDYMMSLTTEEQAEAMLGTWVLTCASDTDESFDENGELHLDGNLTTTLESMVITESEITFNFSSEMPLYTSSATGGEPELESSSTTFTFPHSVNTIPGIRFRMQKNLLYNSESSELAIERTGYNPDGAYISFNLYTKDDVHAVRIVMNAGDCYFEFDKQ